MKYPTSGNSAPPTRNRHDNQRQLLNRTVTHVWICAPRCKRRQIALSDGAYQLVSCSLFGSHRKDYLQNESGFSLWGIALWSVLYLCHREASFLSVLQCFYSYVQPYLCSFRKKRPAQSVQLELPDFSLECRWHKPVKQAFTENRRLCYV